MASDAPDWDTPDVLLRKALGDLRFLASVVASVDALPDDEHVGFLAQQATEKALKAVLARRGVSFRFTHDIRELMNQLIHAGVELPQDLEEADILTPFAAQYRYGDRMESAEQSTRFDREAVLNIAKAAVAWAETVIGGR